MLQGMAEDIKYVAERMLSLADEFQLMVGKRPSASEDDDDRG